MDLTEALDRLYAGKPFDPACLTSGRGFLRSLVRDQATLRELKKRFKDALQFTPKRDFLVGEGLPLSVLILNKHDESPAIETWVGETAWLVIYFGICPELENNVSIIMWPTSSQTSQETYRSIVELIDADYTWLRLEGKYHLELPNQIHPAWVSKIEISPKEKRFFSWTLFPFLKEVRDTLSAFVSPVNYRKVLMRPTGSNGAYQGPYINLRVVAGRFLDQRGDQIRIALPFVQDSRPYLLRLSQYSPERIRLRRREIYSFLILERPDSRMREVYRTQESNAVELVAHRMACLLYKEVLRTKQLRVATLRQLRHLYHDSVKNVAIVCRRDAQSLHAEPMMQYDTVIDYYLSQFFRAVEDEYYYVPQLARELTDRQLLTLNDALINYSYRPAKLHRLVVGNLYWQVQLVLDLKELMAGQTLYRTSIWDVL